MAMNESRRNRLAVDIDSQAGVGGNTVVMIAEAALKIGDVVFISAENSVNKSGTQADYQAAAGVVVGGGSSGGVDYGIFDEGAVGLALVGAAKSVVVQVDGIAYVMAGDAVSAGNALTGDTATAGRVIPTGATAGQIIGIALTDAAVDGDVIKMLVVHK